MSVSGARNGAGTVDEVGCPRNNMVGRTEKSRFQMSEGLSL